MPRYAIAILLEKNDGYYSKRLTLLSIWREKDINTAKGKAIVHDMDKNKDYNLIQALALEIPDEKVNDVQNPTDSKQFPRLVLPTV